MNAIIIEDEYLAAAELERLLGEVAPEITILPKLDSVSESVKWLKKNKADVIFMDIHLGDGQSFDIFEQVEITVPVIFITAYDEYALKAFKYQGIDYILKPYSDDRIISMLNKLEKSYSSNISIDNKLEEEKKFVQKSKASSISLWKNDKLRVVNIKDIYYCEARERETIVYTKDSEYIVKESIKEFEKNLDTNLFFKTHRSYIVNVSKINEIIPWFNNTYKLKLDDINSEIPVSRSKIKDFRIIMNI